MKDFDRDPEQLNLIQAWRLQPDKQNIFEWLSKFMEPEEIVQLQAEAIRALPGPGEQRPGPVHEALVQKETKTCVELAILHPNTDRKRSYEDTHELMLVRRHEKDEHYPGQLGLVGSYLLGHESPKDAVRRIMADKLGLVIDDFVSIEGVETRHKQTKRGPEVGIVVACVLKHALRGRLPIDPEWSEFSDLPVKDMMEHHVDMAYAVGDYLRKKAHTLTL